MGGKVKGGNIHRGGRRAKIQSRIAKKLRLKSKLVKRARENKSTSGVSKVVHDWKQAGIEAERAKSREITPCGNTAVVAMLSHQGTTIRQEGPFLRNKVKQGRNKKEALKRSRHVKP